MRPCVLVVAAVFLALPLASRADTLAGDTVDVMYAFPVASATYIDAGNFTVPSSGVLNSPTTPPIQLASFTLSATQVSVTNGRAQNFSAADFNGVEFTDLNPNTDITNVTIDPSSSFTAGVVTFSSDEIFLNFQGANSVPAGVTEVLDVTAVSTVVAATPEPSSIALLGTGLLALAGTARRRFARS